MTVNAASGGGGGSGGAVTVTTSAAINANGAGAYGLIAQSIGGGGGLAGDSNYSAAKGASGSFAGTVGGSGTSGAVSVTVGGNVIATGAHANAIFAQSVGSSGNGPIAIDIESGTVEASGNTAASVRIADGAGNTLINRGTITTAVGVAGEAVQGGSAGETVDNFGQLTGSVDLGAGANSLVNHQGASFVSGPVVALGTGNLFTNAGRLSVGGDNAVGATAVSGNFTQTASGNDMVDLDAKLPGQVSSVDHLNVTGNASFAGVVTVNVLNPGYISPGHHSAAILTAANGVQTSGVILNAPVSAIASFGLESPDPNTVALGDTVNFAPAGLSGNELAVGNAINAIQAAGSSNAFSPVAATIFGIKTQADLAKAYDSAMPAPQLAGMVAAGFASQRFTDQLFSCAVRGGQSWIGNDDSCVWARIDALRLERRRADQQHAALQRTCLGGGRRRGARRGR